MRRLGATIAVVALVLLVMSNAPAYGHPARIASASAVVSADGSVKLTLTFDAPAYALNDSPDRIADDAMRDFLASPDADVDRQLRDARERLAHALHVTAGGAPVPVEVAAFPTVADLKPWRQAGPQRLPAMLEASARAHLPASARSVAFQLPEILGPVILTIERPGEEAVALAVDAGDPTPELPIQLAVAATAPTAPASTPSVAERPAPAAPSEPGTLWVLARYVRLGFQHIVPEGTDHILFVLGLFFLSPKVRPLLWQVTAFTLAHSITLALSLYGVVHLPERVVEPLIAASIAFVAVENLFTSELKPWRPAVVFAFGLVHGLGFAGVLREAGLPRSQFLPAVLSFNAGVELGQLAVVAAAFLIVGWFQDRTWYRHRVVIPVSIAIALIGLFWTVQRVI